MDGKIAHFRKQFAAETRERIQGITEIALQLEKGGGGREAIDQLKREMHTIKGGSRMLGLKSLARLAHYFEELFQQARSGAAPLPNGLADRLLAALDLMQDLLDTEESADSDRRVTELTAPLQPAGETPAAPRNQGSIRDRLRARIDGRLRHRPPEPLEPPPAPDPEPAALEPTQPAAPLPPPPPPASEEAPPATSAPPGRPALVRSFRIDSSSIDALAEGALQIKVLASVLDVARNEFGQLLKAARGLHAEARLDRDRLPAGPGRDALERLAIQLRDLVGHAERRDTVLAERLHTLRRHFELLASRIEALKLVPLSTAFSIYPRFVRDHAALSGKQIDFGSQGGHIRIDQRVCTAIHDSLIHLLRNAVDHGIEPAADRARSGKPTAGRIDLTAATRGDRVVITLHDDGRGLDTEAIRRQAARRGLSTPEALAELTDEQTHRLIFQPGFSTAPLITDTSGRGVGLDAVRHAVENVGGEISLQSEPGRGVCFRLDVPVSVSTTRVIYIRCGAETLAIPADTIEEIRSVRLSDLTRTFGGYAVVEGHASFPVAILADLLGLTAPAADQRRLLIIGRGGERFGLIVEQTLHEDSILVHARDPFIAGVPHISGLAVDIYGDPFPVLDSRSLGPAVGRTGSARPLAPRSAVSGQPARRVVLLVEDSMVTREMEKAILESAGYQVVEAVNGQEGLEKLGQHDIHCIVTDVEMPLMDGFDLTRRVRQLSAHRDTPIVIVTTRESREDKIRGIEAGANAYITKKDFDQMRLTDTLARLL